MKTSDNMLETMRETCSGDFLEGVSSKTLSSLTLNQLNTNKMNRKTILVVLASAMPSYFSIFMSGVPAVASVCILTFFGLWLTASLMDEFTENQKVIDRVMLAWITHVIGVIISFTLHQTILW